MTTETESGPGRSFRRREVVSQLLENRGGLLVIAGLGAPAWDATAAGDHPLTFPLWGAMGGAVSIGLGLSLAQPERRVLVLTGDGEMLMGLGSLANVGNHRPVNLSVVVLDNERYGETGMQKTHTAGPVDLVGVAKSSGFASSTEITLPEEIESCRDLIHEETGPLFFNIKVQAESPPLVLPPKEGIVLQKRFCNALLGRG